MSVFDFILKLFNASPRDGAANIQKQNYINPAAADKNATQISLQDAVVQSNNIDAPPEFFWPSKFFANGAPLVTSPFGWRNLPGVGNQFHPGTDFATLGKDIVACEDMVIQKVLKPDYEYPAQFAYVNNTWVWANAPAGRAWTPCCICVGKHTKNQYIMYHLDPCVTPGQEVVAGEKIGTDGHDRNVWTGYGYTQGAHLHFEIHPFVSDGVWGDPIDPMPYLIAKNPKA